MATTFSRWVLGGALVVAMSSWAKAAGAFDRGTIFRDDDFAVSKPHSSASASAIPKTPREGGTTEFGIGIAYTNLHLVYPEGGGDQRHTKDIGVFGPALPSLGIGGFLSKEWALLFRLTGTAIITQRFGFVNAFAGPAVQHWPSQRFMLGAGLGLGIAVGDGELGIGTSVRAGYSLTDKPSSSTRIGIELTPTFFRGGWSVTGTALNFEWQAF